MAEFMDALGFANWAKANGIPRIAHFVWSDYWYFVWGQPPFEWLVARKEWSAWAAQAIQGHCELTCCQSLR